MIDAQIILIAEILSLILTPQQRLEALRRLSGGTATDRVYYILWAVAVLALVLMFVFSSLRHKRKARKVAIETFTEYSREKGLSNDESDLLRLLAEKAGLNKSESIFAISTAFERGVEQLLQESLAKGQSPEEIEKSKVVASRLREKLGFVGRLAATPGLVTDLSKLSTRQIPKGKRLHLITQTSGQWNEPGIEVTIEENSPLAMTVGWNEPVRLIYGQPLRVRCYYGASVWEFDTTIAGCASQSLMLNHSGHIRFVNRRRFLRVPVRLLVYLSPYSFAVMPLAVNPPDRRDQRPADATSGELAETATAGPPTRVWGPPEFVQAIATELAGPGLRILSPVKMHMGDRILVIVGLPDDQLQYSEPDHPGGLPTPIRMLEDLAIVRHVKPTAGGWSAAVELTGLSDACVDELIHITNTLSVRLHTPKDNPPAQHAESAVGGLVPAVPASHGVANV